MQLARALKLATPLPIRSAIRPVTRRVERALEHHRLRALYGQIVRPGDLVFDIGAHLGVHTEHFLALGARVVAVEPQPDCQATLHRLVEKWPWPSLAIRQEAVGVSSGTMQLHVSEIPAHATCNTVYQKRRFPKESFDESITVPQTTLENLIAKYGLPDYVKIDIEGLEMEALAGLGKNRPRFISFEFSRENWRDVPVCDNFFLPAQYNVTLYGNHQFELKRWVTWEHLESYLADSNDPHLCGDIFARLI